MEVENVDTDTPKWRKTSAVTENNEIIEIYIANISGDQVKIGFEAPQSCRILRDELFDEKAALHS